MVLLDVRIVRKMLDTVDGTLSSEMESAGPREGSYDELAGGVTKGTQIARADSTTTDAKYCDKQKEI